MFINPDSSYFGASKIISLVPSITELLCDIGLQDQLIGVTKFCIYPKTIFGAKEKIGGTKNINIKKIIALAPDLIIANNEENVKEQIEELAQLFNVYVSCVDTYKAALQMILDVGQITNTKAATETICSNIETGFKRLPFAPAPPKKVAYLIWKDPYMTVGGDTFISDMLRAAGFKNMYENNKRYPVVTLQELQKNQPDLIFLSTEPYPFKEKHVKEMQQLFVKTTIVLVDGEMFSWYGSRMLLMPEYFKKLVQSIEENETLQHEII